MVNAFDTAWAIVKMPIVPNQLEYLGESPNLGGEDSFFTETKRWKTMFQDPKTQELLPLFVDYGNYLNREGKKYQSFKGSIGDDKRGGRLRYEGDDRRSITGVNFHDNVESRHPYWTETRKDHREKGYASALYDVIAYLMQNEGEYALNPSHEQKAAAKEMWKGREKWPVRDDL